jgi:dTDP-4-dehydrorhamnose reductase
LKRRDFSRAVIPATDPGFSPRGNLLSEPQRILITGTTGQIGGELLRLFPKALAPTRADIDLTDEASIRACIRHHSPRWIINPAAYTAVDKAESEPDLAHAVNADAPRILGEEAQKIGATVLHFSTDYVFDGTKSAPYLEDDPTNPLGVYGASKLAGEQALAASGAAHIILRTSWVYGATGKNFLLTILKLAAERPELKIVADQHGAPTWSRDLATLAAKLIVAESIPSGVYHATSSGETTWHGFATEFLRLANIRTNLIPIPTSAYLTPARRPANSRLNCDKLYRTVGVQLPNWQTSLAVVMQELTA